MITGIAHSGFVVAQLERSLGFYRDLLGFELLFVREHASPYFGAIVGAPGCTVRVAHLRHPSAAHVLELVEFVAPPTEPRVTGPLSQGSAHLCLLVSDLAALYAQLHAAGVAFRSPAPVPIDSGVNAGGVAIYALDPDGIVVELFQTPQSELRIED